MAKAYADYVLIAGHNGGTGASPLSSIKHAGSPWELGLAEAQATLVRNGLRHRIEVRTDGGLKTGRDVVIAALLGAETLRLRHRAAGGDGLRHGPAVPHQHLPHRHRDPARGPAGQVQGHAGAGHHLLHAAGGGGAADPGRMGFRSLDEIIGRNDLLAAGRAAGRAAGPDARPLDAAGDRRRWKCRSGAARRCSVAPSLGTTGPGWCRSTRRSSTDLEPYLESGLPFSGNYPIYNHHLAVGARVAGAIAERHGDAGLPTGSVRLRFTGSAGQSFGAFTCRGMHLELEGEANDYVAKGLSGGELIIRPFRRAAYADASHLHLIIGNTVLYGATAGKLFAAGQAGDRFAVRNSGAVAVIEGAGNHCCEYMTSGIVVVLGRAGRNFGAGMSNGVAYVVDEAGTFESRVNKDMVETSALDDADLALLQRLIREHEEKTASPRARRILVQWDQFVPLFRKVAPKDSAGLVAATREAYLQSASSEPDLVPARRSA